MSKGTLRSLRRVSSLNCRLGRLNVLVLISLHFVYRNDDSAKPNWSKFKRRRLRLA